MNIVCSLLLQDERDDGEAREATDADDGTGSSSDEDDQSAASKSAEHTRVRPSAPPSKPFDAQLTRRIPAWCRGELKFKALWDAPAFRQRK